MTIESVEITSNITQSIFTLSDIAKGSFSVNCGITQLLISTSLYSNSYNYNSGIVQNVNAYSKVDLEAI